MEAAGGGTLKMLVRSTILFVATVAVAGAFLPPRSPSSSKALRASELSPEPETRQKQLKFLKARGFVYDRERGLWTRPPENAKGKKRPALVKGGSNRVLEVFATDEAKARRAAAEVTKTLRSARAERVSPRTSLEAMGSRAVAATPGGRILLGSSQLCLWGLVTNRLAESFVRFEPSELLAVDETLPLAACAVTFAFLATGEGATKWSGSGLSGRLEAAAADGWRGAHSVPAPASWRASDRGWRLRAATLDLLAAWPRCLAFHAALQAPLDTELQRLLFFFEDPLDNARASAFLAIGAVSLFAVAADLLGAQQDSERDAQRQAEIDALKESLNSDDGCDDLYADIASAWINNFQHDSGISHPVKNTTSPSSPKSIITVALIAFCRAAAVASAYRVAGDNLVAPLSLHALAALTAVFLSEAPDEDPDRAVCTIP